MLGDFTSFCEKSLALPFKNMSFQIPTLPAMPSVKAQNVAHTYIEKANKFLKRIKNVGTEAPSNLVVGMMRLLEWWYEVRVLGMGWDHEIKVQEWCCACYVDNHGTK